MTYKHDAALFVDMLKGQVTTSVFLQKRSLLMFSPGDQTEPRMHQPIKCPPPDMAYKHDTALFVDTLTCQVTTDELTHLCFAETFTADV